MLPAANADEVALVPGLQAWAADTFDAVCRDLRGEQAMEPIQASTEDSCEHALTFDDMADVRGQTMARRALEIAAAGGHGLLFVGPPGAGKSMLAQRLPGILPPLQDAEALESGAVASLAGAFDPARWRQRPFRAPHHSATMVALVGGGTRPRPGEISLAHHGVLFLDELPEFGSRTLESLREPMETGRVQLARANHRLNLPASFQLVAACNPCPCGYLGEGRCRCSPAIVARYQRRLSGPLLDRLDMHLWVAPVPPEQLLTAPPGEASNIIAARVLRAREQQLARQGCINARLAARELDQHCPVQTDARAMLLRAAASLQWSGRVVHRVLRVARTIADLGGEGPISSASLAEAVGLRRALFAENAQAA